MKLYVYDKNGIKFECKVNSIETIYHGNPLLYCELGRVIGSTSTNLCGDDKMLISLREVDAIELLKWNVR